MKKSMLITGMLCAASAGWSTIVTDNFNRGNTSPSSDTSLIGANWKQASGSTDEWLISGNYLHSHATASPGILYNDALETVSGNGTNFDLSMDVASKTSGAWAGLVFNYQDDSNYYVVRFKSDSAGYQVLKVVGGSVGVLAYGSTSTNVKEDVFYTVSVASDTPYVFNITIKEAGQSEVFGEGQTTDKSNNFTGGYAGGYANSTGYSAGYDNLSLEVIPEPATLGLVGMIAAGLIFVRRRLML